MTKTAHEEYVQMVGEIQTMLGTMDTHLKDVDREFNTVSGMIAAIEKVTTDPIVKLCLKEMAMHVRNSITGHLANAYAAQLLLLATWKLAALADANTEIRLEIPAKYEKALQEITDRIEAGEKARKAYTG